MKTKDLAVAVVFAALYTGIGYLFHPVSFLQIQVRIPDALYPLIALFGMPSLLGLTIGHFLLNLSSPLGPIDLLSVVLFIPAKMAIGKWGLKAVPLHVISIALWVPTMICFFAPQEFAAPSFMLPTIIVFVAIGEAIAEIGLGFPLTLAIKRRLKNANP